MEKNLHGKYSSYEIYKILKKKVYKIYNKIENKT